MSGSVRLGATVALAAGLLPHLAGPDPTPQAGDVKPGWVALVIVLILCVVTTLLWLSMRRHLGRIRFDEDADPARTEAPAGDPAADRREEREPGQG